MKRRIVDREDGCLHRMENKSVHVLMFIFHSSEVKKGHQMQD